MRLLTGMDQNALEWTGMDLYNQNGPQINPKIHVLSVLDKKFWLSDVKYKKSRRPVSLNAKMFSKIFSVLS